MIVLSNLFRRVMQYMGFCRWPVVRLFGLFPGLDKILISLRDVMAAIVGSLLVLAALWAWRHQRN